MPEKDTFQIYHPDGNVSFEQSTEKCGQGIFRPIPKGRKDLRCPMMVLIGVYKLTDSDWLRMSRSRKSGRDPLPPCDSYDDEAKTFHIFRFANISKENVDYKCAQICEICKYLGRKEYVKRITYQKQNLRDDFDAVHSINLALWSAMKSNMANKGKE